MDRGWMTIHYNGRDLTLRPNDLYTYSPGLPVDVIATSRDFHGLCLIISLMLRFLLGCLTKTMADEEVINFWPPHLVNFIVVAYVYSIG